MMLYVKGRRRRERGFPRALRRGTGGERSGALGGAWRLADGGDGVLAAVRTPGAGGAVALQVEPGGLALLLTGAARCEDVRAAGLLAGTDRHDDALDALLRDRPVATLDYF